MPGRLRRAMQADRSSAHIAIARIDAQKVGLIIGSMTNRGTVTSIDPQIAAATIATASTGVLNFLNALTRRNSDVRSAATWNANVLEMTGLAPQKSGLVRPARARLTIAVST